MEKLNLITLGLLLLTISCSNPNKEYLERIKQKVKKDAMGVEMRYKSITFQWIDTLFVKEKLSKLAENYNERLNVILGLEYYVKDNFEKGKIFSKNYLTKHRVEELRNWEKVNRGIPFDKEYKDYYEFAFANRNASQWISDLCKQIEETDSLLNNYENIKEGNLRLIENVNWYYNRIDNFNSNHNPDSIWSKVSNELIELKEMKLEIDSLSTINPDKVIYYKSINIYKINNPILNGAEQELTKYFLFDDQFKIIGDEDYEK